ncbi:uncharacterized protein LOC108733446 [Agrilus planipennis]|uniref:Uncharacterized protein LOC108733446 n=1 Tax=Agrilus planipennis TaxID=224129 RepID=A0A1W4WJC7_AGRPL|nr:uncharacterized protein LOC108733446 [Agrilus planipennis]
MKMEKDIQGCLFIWVLLLIVPIILPVESQRLNPTILQDSRDLPTPEGSFGFLYRTEDGIAHGARGDPNGQVHGRFTYTDPTGLKVNFNYNAGSRATPGYNYNDVQQQQQQQSAIRDRQPAPPAVEEIQEYQERRNSQPPRPILYATKNAQRTPQRAESVSPVEDTNDYDNYYDQPRRNSGRNANYYDEQQPRTYSRRADTNNYNDVSY